MKEKVYVDRLFADYEDSTEIVDFKEEITTNLTANVRNLVSKGLDEEEAFEKATAELGDITAIADDIGKKKRNEAIGQMYMNARVPVTKRTAAGMTAASALLLIAAGITLITLLSSVSPASGVALYVISAVLLPIAGGLYTYFGSTQETTAHYAVKHKRALAYGIVSFAILLGAALAAVAFFPGKQSLIVAGCIIAAFFIPSICVLIFLLITEPKRQKPWLKAMVEREVGNSMMFANNMVDPAKAARFGVLSGGVCLLSVAVFLTLHFALSIPHAWLVFLFMLAIQSFMTSMIFGKKKDK